MRIQGFGFYIFAQMMLFGDFDEWDCDSDENEDDADIMYYQISLTFTLLVCFLQFLLFYCI